MNRKTDWYAPWHAENNWSDTQFVEGEYVTHLILEPENAIIRAALVDSCSETRELAERKNRRAANLITAAPEMYKILTALESCKFIKDTAALGLCVESIIEKAVKILDYIEECKMHGDLNYEQ